MIKLQPSILTSSSIRYLASLKASQTYKSTLNFQQFSTSIKNPQSQHNPTQIITVCLDSIVKHKQILQWRKNTDFPIVKIKSYTFLEKKHDFGSSFLQILLELESQMKKFNNLKNLPIFQVIYILKESLIGFQRLCHKFGFFNVSSDMIMFTESQNCKVWINKEWYSNQIEPSSIKTEKQFILELCNVVEQKAVKSKVSSEFFMKVKNCKHFFEAVGCIETFTQTNRIKIPNKFQNLEDLKSPLLKTSTTIDTKRNNLVTSSKLPHFIKKTQQKQPIQQEIHTTLPRKISMTTQIWAGDRFFGNISRKHSTNSFLKNQNTGNRIQEKESTVVEDSFLQDMNIRLIQPNGEQGRDAANQSHNFSEKQLIDTPKTQYSPIGVVSEYDVNDDKKSNFSFTRGIRRQGSSSFEMAERMFLTVCKSVSKNADFSPVKKQRPQFSPKAIKTLKYLETKEIESQNDFMLQQKENLEAKKKKFVPLNISEIKEKRRLSGDFENGSGRLDEEQCKGNDEEQELYTPQYRTGNILNLPRQSYNGLNKSPSHLVISRNIKRKQESELFEQQKQQQEREFLRENIMSVNGWKGLSILQQKREIQKSFVDEGEIPIRGQTKTSW